MIELQYLSKLIISKEYSLLSASGIGVDHFPNYSKEYEFIKAHFDKYNTIPDIATFQNKFPDFKLIQVSESDDYLISALRESYTYNRAREILTKSEDLVNEDSNIGVNYIIKELSALPTNFGVVGEDIIHDAEKRYETLIDRKNNRDKYFFKTGLTELDMVTGGIQRKEEFILLFARTNQGKSWISQKIAISVWEQGYNVGYFSPEMSGESIGYRFDTMYKHFSNSMLVNAIDVGDEEAVYKQYIEDLRKHKNKFLVTTPKSFGKDTTVSAIRSWILENKLDFLVIDGMTYLKNERGRSKENTTERLTSISEDIMELSVEIGVPIIGVVQANREAAGDDVITAPTLETVRGSDGFAHNASKVFSMRKTSNTLELAILKQRNGVVGNKLLWDWDVDKGFFQYKPNKASGLEQHDAEISGELTSKFNDSSEFTDVF